MPEFTPSQIKAIETKGKSLVVSAGAGSGKTTVLTERIIQGIKQGGDIDDILVVTFTNAAASDMKEKLYKALSEAAAEDVNNKRLAEMSLKISSARISTISSFCLGFIKDNFELLGLSPKIRIADGSEAEAILQSCLDRVIENAFDSDINSITVLADTLGGDKNFNKLNSVIISLYHKFRASPFWKDKLEAAIKDRTEQAEICREEGFFATRDGKYVIDQIKTLLLSAQKRTQRLLEFINTVATNEKHFTTVQKMLDDITLIYEGVTDDYDSLKQSVCSFSAGRLYKIGIEHDAGEYISSEKSAIVDIMNDVRLYFSFTKEQITSDWFGVTRLNKALKNIVFALDEAYTAEKRRRAICDFADAEHYTLELLALKTPNGVVRSELCRRFCQSVREVYVDEYQDVSPLQDMIFSLITRDDNGFFVGDVKQSVYRFRNASAKIFGDRVKNARPLEEEGSVGKIFLRENFRCTNNIIEFVNTVFEELYTVENTGYSYSDEKLVCGVGDICRLSVDVEAITDVPAGTGNECEARLAAARIASLVGKARKKDGSVLEYKDFAILMRATTGRIHDYEKVFRKYKIPFSTDSSLALTDRPEVMLALSLLSAIDDPTDEIALAGALRSSVFCFSAEELRLVRNYRPEAPFIYAISACANCFVRKTKHTVYKPSRSRKGVKACVRRYKSLRGERPNITVLEKCFEFKRFLREFSALSLEMPSHKLIWKLFDATRLVETVSCEKHGEEKKNNLLTLYRLAVSFENGSLRGLSAFLDYMKNIGDTGETVFSSENTVKILTFHKSKGLEFPVCIVCGTGTKFNVKDLQQSYVVDSDGFVLFDLKGAGGLCTYQPIIKTAAMSKEKHEMLAEELRCLYVALTRAKEQLYVIGVLDGEPLSLVDRIMNKGFFELNSNLERIIKAVNEKNSKCYTFKTIMSDTLPNPDEVRHKLFEKQEDKSVLWEEYGHSNALSVPAKVSVSELRLGLLEDDEYDRSVVSGVSLKVPEFAVQAKVSQADKGTATHLFMQFCSFERVEKHGVRAEAAALAKNGLIAETDIQLIRFSELERFFESELYKQMRKSDYMKREMRFTLAEDSSLFSKAEGETVLVQGVIDCFYRNPDGTYTVIDYKTDRVGENGGEQILELRHKAQLGYYARAVEKMTSARVKNAFLYSFALGKAIRVKL